MDNIRPHREQKEQDQGMGFLVGILAKNEK